MFVTFKLFVSWQIRGASVLLKVPYIDLFCQSPSEENQQKMASRMHKMYTRYHRAESFRKSLVYQKKYLLLLLGGFQVALSLRLCVQVLLWKITFNLQLNPRKEICFVFLVFPFQWLVAYLLPVHRRGKAY